MKHTNKLISYLLIGSLLGSFTPSQAGILDILQNRTILKGVAAVGCTALGIWTVYKNSSKKTQEKILTATRKAKTVAKATTILAGGAAALLGAAKLVEKIPGTPEKIYDETFKMFFITAPLGALVNYGFNRLQELQETLILRPTEPAHTLDSLPGSKPELLQLFINKMQHPALYEANHTNGILLHGPSGTGKTSYAHAIAHALQAPLFVVNAGQICTPTLMAAPRNINTVFAQVTKAAQESPTGKVVLCLEEVDGIATNRNRVRPDSMAILILNTLLAQLSTQIQDSIIVVATTNRLYDCDGALYREGRLTPILMDTPDEQNRITILDYLLRKKNYTGSKSIVREVAGATNGFSQAALAGLVDQAQQLADYKLVSLDDECLRDSWRLTIRNRPEYNYRR